MDYLLFSQFFGTAESFTELRCSHKGFYKNNDGFDVAIVGHGFCHVSVTNDSLCHQGKRLIKYSKQLKLENKILSSPNV